MKQNPPKNRCKRLRKLTHHCSTLAPTSVVSGSYQPSSTQARELGSSLGSAWVMLG